MSQGMNNAGPFTGQASTPDFDPVQSLLLGQQQFMSMLSPDLTQNLMRFNPYASLLSMTNPASIQKDLFSQHNLLNMAPQPTQLEFLKLLQNMGPVLAQLNHFACPPPQLNFNQKLRNTAENPITVDDDEPLQPPKKCHNSLCKNVGDKKIKSKRHDCLFFCDKCAKLYNKGNYCDFCEQVYGSYDDEAGWIQCDQCQKWNHIACEQKCRNQNIHNEPESTPYHCLTCVKTIKKLKPPKKVEEPQQQVYKPRNVLEQEDCRSREKNITFVATKDNKVQYTFRLNLLEDEIRQDLDFLRNSTKKVKKPLNLPSPPRQMISQQQQQQQQIQDNSESNMNRNLRRRQNQKVNYRDLVGEY